MNKPSLLARLFGRSASPVVAQLYASVIGQPLLVHPQIGEQLIGGYLHGAVEARPPTLAIGELVPASPSLGGIVTPARRVAVLNVSGALVNRFEPGLCDPGPLSYQELRSAFTRALTDDSIEAIVFRLESPGGMGSGLFDLTDHIFASRGKKMIVAAIDDYAYSACYGIAAACDEIWITRTGGVGSVGVIAYHTDQSAFDAKIGVKVTAVYSGEHKNDLSPHAPLDDGTRAWLQGRMDSMRALFASSVAKYRGLELDAVLATQAQVYQGEEAIAAGFADRLGTYHDVMEHLTASHDQPSMQQPAAGGDEAARSATVEASHEEIVAPVERVDAAQLAWTSAITNAALTPALSVALLRRGHQAQVADEAIRYAGAVRDLCVAAGIEDVAADYVVGNTSLEAVRAELLAVKAEDGPEIVTALPKNEVSAIGGSMHTDTYRRRRAAAAGQVESPAAHRSSPR